MGDDTEGSAAVLRVSAAIAFLVAAAAVWTAALLPQFFPVWGARWADVLDVIGANLDLWRFDTVLFFASATLTLLGAALAFWPGRDALAGLWGASLLALAVGTGLWAVSLAFRLTVVVAATEAPALGSDPWFSVTVEWMAAVWNSAAVFLILGLVGLGAALLITRRLPRWVGWTTIAVAAISVGMLVVLRDVPPVVVYLPLLPWGVGLLVPGRTGTSTRR